MNVQRRTVHKPLQQTTKMLTEILPIKSDLNDFPRFARLLPIEVGDVTSHRHNNDRLSLPRTSN